MIKRSNEVRYSWREDHITNVHPTTELTECYCDIDDNRRLALVVRILLLEQFQ